jgi:hypothetical protein
VCLDNAFVLIEGHPPEDAYWFPSMSFAAGARDLTALGIASQNFGGPCGQYSCGAPSAGLLDLTTGQVKGNTIGVDSHTYLYTVPFSHVYPAFQSLAVDLQ